MKGLSLSCLLLAFGTATAQDVFESMHVVRPRVSLAAPPFRLETLDGEIVASSRFHGRPLVLAFWASWCRSCDRELASLAELGRSVPDLVILAISIDRQRERALHAIEGLETGFPVLIDPDRRVARRYEVTGVPTTYLIGTDGRFRGLVIGERDWNSDEARRLVARLFTKTGNDAIRPADSASLR